MFDAKAFVSGLPNLPGVYRMLGKGGEALYVGKARDLKKRVASYFQKHSHSPRTQMMVSQVASVEVTATRCRPASRCSTVITAAATTRTRGA